MQVDLSGQKFVFPPQCACCGNPPQATLTAVATRTTGKRVVHTTAKSWDFPYCAQCLAHVQAADQAKTTALCLVIASLLAAACLYFFTGIAVLACIAAVGGIGGSIAAYNNMMLKAKAQCATTCACVQRAVQYLGWQGTCHMFEVVSHAHALAFMTTNQKKLVNVRPEVWQWLNANGCGTPMQQAQSPKRHIY